MSLKSGFFDAVEIAEGVYDRVYAAAEFAHYFALLVGNGVFPTPKEGMNVKASEPASMVVNIGDGSCWINGYYATVEGGYSVTVDPAEGSQKRIDSIVAQWRADDREIRIISKKGAPGANPEPVTLQRDAEFWEIELAQITLEAGVSNIQQTKIDDTRADKDRCGVVAAMLDAIDPSSFLAQSEALFNEWFDTIKGQISSDVAGSLLAMIEDLKRDKLDKSAKATSSEITDSSIDDKYITPKAFTEAFASNNSLQGYSAFGMHSSSYTWNRVFLPNGFLIYWPKDGDTVTLSYQRSVDSKLGTYRVSGQKFNFVAADPEIVIFALAGTVTGSAYRYLVFKYSASGLEVQADITLTEQLAYNLLYSTLLGYEKVSFVGSVSQVIYNKLYFCANSSDIQGAYANFMEYNKSTKQITKKVQLPGRSLYIYGGCLGVFDGAFTWIAVRGTSNDVQLYWIRKETTTYNKLGSMSDTDNDLVGAFYVCCGKNNRTAITSEMLDSSSTYIYDTSGSSPVLAASIPVKDPLTFDGEVLIDRATGLAYSFIDGSRVLDRDVPRRTYTRLPLSLDSSYRLHYVNSKVALNVDKDNTLVFPDYMNKVSMGTKGLSTIYKKTGKRFFLPQVIIDE